MARLQYTANSPDNQQGLEDFTPIPAGDVIGIITKSQYKLTKAKTGNYLQLIWKVQGGKYNGRTLFDNLNLDNPNPIAVEIANKTLNSICKACQKVGVQDSEELHGIYVKLTLSVQAATETNPASNNIKAYTTPKPEDMSIGAEQAMNATVTDASPATGTGMGPDPPPIDDPSPEAAPQKLPWEE